jgi:uncharacterized protein (DUF2249 family)
MDPHAGVTRENTNTAEDEDAELLWQATARAEEFLDALAANRSTAADLRALLNYLRDVVLTRISEEERYVLPSLGQAGTQEAHLARLREDHLSLRDDIDELAEASAPHSVSSADQLAGITRRLIVRLEDHLRREAATLAEVSIGYRPSASAWAATTHWYPLTEGPVIDLDTLPPDRAHEAVLNRLTSLRAGEHVELHGHNEPDRLWERLQRRAPGDYTWRPHVDEQNGWRVLVTRRPTD